MYMQAQLIHRGYISYAYILHQDKEIFLSNKRYSLQCKIWCGRKIVLIDLSMEIRMVINCGWM